MKNTIVDDLKDIKPEMLKGYLEKRDSWQAGKSIARGLGIVYESPLTSDAILVLKSQDLADYSTRMHENLKVLSSVEDRSAKEILNELLAPTEDIVSVELEISDEKQFLSVSEVSDFLDSILNLMKIAAETSFAKSNVPTNRRLELIYKYLKTIYVKNIEVSQSCFVFQISSPTNSQIANQLLDPHSEEICFSPLEKLVYLLSWAHSLTVNSKLKDRLNVTEETVGTEFNPKLCDSICKLTSSHRRVCFTIRWSPANETKTDDVSVAFDDADGMLLQELSQQLLTNR